MVLSEASLEGLYGCMLRVLYGSRLRVLYGSKCRVLYGTSAVCSTEHVHTQREIDMWTNRQNPGRGSPLCYEEHLLLFTVVINRKNVSEGR